jgi:hypothetical protein
VKALLGRELDVATIIEDLHTRRLDLLGQVKPRPPCPVYGTGIG